MSEASSKTRQKWVEGSTLGVGVVMVLALLGMVNYLAARHYERFDWTTHRIYSLSEKTRDVLAGLDQNVEAVVVMNPSSEIYEQVDELLSRYAAANSEHFSKKTLDPVRDPLEAQRLVEQHSIQKDNVVVVATATDRRVIDAGDLAEYDYSGAQMGEAPKLVEFKGEQQITSAILALTEAEKPRILFVTGHGEAGTSELDVARTYLGQDNFTMDDWTPFGQTAVPANADLVVVAAPKTAFTQPELDLFTAYLDGGGRMLWLLDPVLSSTDPKSARMIDLGLGDWLAGYGVAIDQDLVIDPASELPMFGPEVIFSADYGFHPIVDALRQTGTRVLLTLSRSVRKVDPPPAGMKVDELVRTSADGWGETRLDSEQLGFDDGEDVRGPVALGVAVSFPIHAPGDTAAESAGADPDSAVDPAGDEEQTGDDDVPLFDPDEGAEEGAEKPATPPEKEARLVVLGDADFAGDQQIDSAGNRVLLLNAFNWLVKREKLIDIEGRKPETTHLTLAGGELWTIAVLVLVIMPGLSVAMGISVFLKRRR